MIRPSNVTLNGKPPLSCVSNGPIASVGPNSASDVMAIASLHLFHLSLDAVLSSQRPPVPNLRPLSSCVRAVFVGYMKRICSKLKKVDHKHLDAAETMLEEQRPSRRARVICCVIFGAISIACVIYLGYLLNNTSGPSRADIPRVRSRSDDVIAADTTPSPTRPLATASPTHEPTFAPTGTHDTRRLITIPTKLIVEREIAHEWMMNGSIMGPEYRAFVAQQLGAEYIGADVSALVLKFSQLKSNDGCHWPMLFNLWYVNRVQCVRFVRAIARSSRVNGAILEVVTRDEPTCSYVCNRQLEGLEGVEYNALVASGAVYWSAGHASGISDTSIFGGYVAQICA